MKVVLFGMKHSGKSTLGRKLAREWNCPFFDLDGLLEKDFEEESGVKTPVRQIFAQTGEEAYDKQGQSGQSKGSAREKIQTEASNQPPDNSLSGSS